MTRQLKHSLLRAALVMLAMPVVPQRTATADPGPAQRSRPTPGNQQERSAQGVNSGQLTAGETARLEKRQARINTEVRNDRAANGGKLTPQEKARVNRQQDRQSRQIYRDQHNPGQQ